MRYVEGGDNSVLKLALLEVWTHSCYWHSKPLAFHEAEIDHIIPKAQADRPEVMKNYPGSVGFDVHDPANLAPICRECNSDKAAVDYTDSPPVLTRLKKAITRRNRVITRVLAARSERRISKHAVALGTASFASHVDRAAFLQHGPAIVQRLADIDPSAVDFRTGLTVDLDRLDDWHGGAGPARSVSASLNNEARRSQLIALHVCGASLETLLERASDAIEDTLSTEHDGWTDGRADDLHPEPLTSGGAVVQYHDALFDIIEFACVDDTYVFNLRAQVDSSLVASATRSDVHGDGLEDVQVEARVDGPVTVQLSWTVGDAPGTFDILDVDTRKAYAERWEE